MKIEQSRRTEDGIWEYSVVNELKNPLVFVFGDRMLLEDTKIYDEIKDFYPDGHIIFGSTSGEILGVNVYEKNISVTAIEFSNTEYKVANENISNHDSIESFEVLYNRYKLVMFKYLRKILNDQGLAEDLTQETFLKIFKSRKTFSFDKKFNSFTVGPQPTIELFLSI